MEDRLAFDVSSDFGFDTPNFDVNDDGYISPVDALGVVNELNRVAGESEPTMDGDERSKRSPFDVSGDGAVSPIDAKLVFDELNRLYDRVAAFGAEGEDDDCAASNANNRISILAPVTLQEPDDAASTQTMTIAVLRTRYDCSMSVRLYGPGVETRRN